MEASTSREHVSSQKAEESSIAESVDIAPDAKFECPICLSWLRDPVVTACGHRFCKNCIDSWLAKDKKFCPVDNMKLQYSDIYPDNFTRREISQQRTKCPYLKRGCLEELSPLDVESHLLECKYKPIEYQLPDNEKLRCNFVDVGCDAKFDDEPGLQRHLEHDIQKHLMLLISVYRTMSINNHGSAASAIAQEANFWDPPAKSEQGHSSRSIGAEQSIENLLKTLYEKIVVLEQKSREQDIIISNMSEQISTNNLKISQLAQRFCNGSYIWHITDFKTKMKDNPLLMIYSPGFFTSYNGYKLCIRLNLSPKDPNYIALLIHMMKTDHDNTLDWPFCGRITIIIVHPTHSFLNIKETMMTSPELDAFKRPVKDMNQIGFGYTEFANLNDLLSNGFLENNNLVVKVDIQPV